MEANCLVTGSAGFVGRHLIRQLVKGEAPTICLYRHRLPEAHEKVVPFYSDLSSAEQLLTPLKGIETVVHLAWGCNFVGPNENLNSTREIRSLFTQNIKALRNVIHAMERLGTRRLVFLSVKGAELTTEIPFLKEKYIAEHYILNSDITEKIIIRCPVIWSGVKQHDRFISAILRAMRLPIFSFMPNFKKQIYLTHVDNIVDRIVEISQGQNTAKLVVEPPTQSTYSIEELFRMTATIVLSKNKLAIGGIIGDTLLPLFERQTAPKLRQFLSLS